MTALHMDDLRQHDPSPERRLWATVLLTAIFDLCSDRRYVSGGVADHARHDAERWFRHAGRDFREVCHLAGCDPDAVLDHVRPLLDLPLADRAHVVRRAVANPGPRKRKAEAGA